MSGRYLLPVDVDGVVVEPGVAHQPGPLVPAHRHPVPVVLVQVLAEVPCIKKERERERER